MASTIEGVEVEGLPAELTSLGRPDAVFEAKGLRGKAAATMLMACGVLMLVLAGMMVSVYANVTFPDDGPPGEIVLGVGILSAVFGVGFIASVSHRSSGKDQPVAFQGFLVYPTALVRVKDGQSTIFPWEQVEALVNPERAFADFQVLASDGRKVPVDRGVNGYRDLLGMLHDWVRGERLERARREFAAGQTVAFGPFGVSRDALEYKGKKLPWDQMSVFEVVIQQGGHRRLRIKRRGTIWPWSYALLYGLPNEAIFFTLIEEARLSRRYA